MKDILFITYDFFKDGYLKIPYSIAVLQAFLQKQQISSEHYSIDLTPFKDLETSEIDAKVSELTKKDLLPKLSEYKTIALSVNSWSGFYVQEILPVIRKDYSGIIVLGGYDVTACSESDLNNYFPDADFYIIGYAEESLLKIINGEFPPKLNKDQFLEKDIEIAESGKRIVISIKDIEKSDENARTLINMLEYIKTMILALA